MCTYPSAGNGGNNNPFDCIVNPGGGFLVIVKNAGNDTTTSFPFVVSPVPNGTASGYTVVGSSETDPISSPRRQRDRDSHREGAGRMAAHERGVRSGGNHCHGVVRRRQQSRHGHLDPVGPRDDLHLQRCQGRPRPLAGEVGVAVDVPTVGQTISYSYLVTNTGNVPLAGPVTVADDKATVTCPAVSTVGNHDGFLDPGEAVTCTATYTITQADLNTGSVTNTAKAAPAAPTPTRTPRRSPPCQTKALSLVKSAPPSTYRRSVSRSPTATWSPTRGNVPLAGPVTVADDKATVTCPDVSRSATTSFLDPGEAITCTATYTITQADLNSGSVTNTAKASAGGIDSNEDTETVTAVQTKALSLVKSASPSTYSTVGQPITYSYLVTNTGNVPRRPGHGRRRQGDRDLPGVSTVGNTTASSIRARPSPAPPPTRSPRPT